MATEEYRKIEKLVLYHLNHHSSLTCNNLAICHIGSSVDLSKSGTQLGFFEDR